VIAAPFRARFVDRRGQRLGLRLLALGYAAGVAALVLAATLGATATALVACAAAAGASAPPVGAAMRMRWRLLVAGPGQVASAYSLDATSEEAIYTLGPVVVGLAMAVTIPQAGLAASAALALAGCFLMTTAATSPPPGALPAVPRTARPRLLGVPGFAPALLVTGATGAVVGGVDVIVPAQLSPDDTLAGVLLGALALGSGIGGLAYGTRAWPWPVRTRLLGLAAAMSAACAVLAALPSAILLAAGLVITGLALAPAMVSGYLLADTLTDDGTRLEASTWVNTAVNAGAAASSAFIGLVLDRSTPAWAYCATSLLAASLILLGTITAAGHRLSRKRHYSHRATASQPSPVSDSC
jgi:predicted MFS family arabinose efflux permease